MKKLLFIACTNVARYLISDLYWNENMKGIEVVGIVNLNREQSLKKSNYDDYFDLIVEHNISHFYCNNVNDSECLDWIRSKKPDLIIQSGWSQKFSDDLLEIPIQGCIGQHPSPLPKGRGAACVNWAIINGETKWGDTFFRMVNEYDKGSIVEQELFDIMFYDTVKTIYDKVCLSSLIMFRRSIKKWLNGEFNIHKQDESKASYYKKRKPSDGFFSFTDKTAIELYNFIRAQTKPYPGAFFVFKKKKIKVWEATISDIKQQKEAGTFLNKTSNGGLLISCFDNTAIEILRIEEEGLPELWAADWYDFFRDNHSLNEF